MPPRSSPARSCTARRTCRRNTSTNWNAQAQRNVTCLQTWIDRGQLAPVDPHHLLFAIWAATQTYADFDWQISIVTGKEQLSDADYDAAVETITRLVLKGCTPDGQSGKSAGRLRPLPL